MLFVLKTLQRPRLPQSKALVLLVTLKVSFPPPHLRLHLWYLALLHSSMAMLATLLFLTHARLTPASGTLQLLSLLESVLPPRCV